MQATAFATTRSLPHPCTPPPCCLSIPLGLATVRQCKPLSKSSCNSCCTSACSMPIAHRRQGKRLRPVFGWERVCVDLSTLRRLGAQPVHGLVPRGRGAVRLQPRKPPPGWACHARRGARRAAARRAPRMAWAPPRGKGRSVEGAPQVPRSVAGPQPAAPPPPRVSTASCRAPRVRCAPHAGVGGVHS